jgi:hypothetical protein
VPQWEDDDEVLRRNDGVSRLCEGIGELTALEILLRAQDGKSRCATSVRVIAQASASAWQRRLPPGSGWPWIIVTRRGVASVPLRSGVLTAEDVPIEPRRL